MLVMWSGFYCYCLHSHCLAHLDSQLLSGYECLRYEMAVTVPLQQGLFDHLVYDQLLCLTGCLSGLVSEFQNLAPPGFASAVPLIALVLKGLIWELTEEVCLQQWLCDHHGEEIDAHKSDWIYSLALCAANVVLISLLSSGLHFPKSSISCALFQNFLRFHSLPKLVSVLICGTYSARNFQPLSATVHSYKEKWRLMTRSFLLRKLNYFL